MVFMIKIKPVMEESNGMGIPGSLYGNSRKQTVSFVHHFTLFPASLKHTDVDEPSLHLLVSGTTS